ncbi:MAG: BLUF domain-containing protein [Cytophagales bacterium]|jgi:hypothetical protein|nr:BLUF domain-containing protein [Cytophagales bacterium]MCA6388420.1 BLUF domain-containing protein [Cytophagales bacterium]MCA6392527.1 BLUF domain-containing protein [Cytophagales bacterium]MCA6395734.1 BLUF domain-containing protein [Cytophagales bacterium]MCA6400121.1 BLUF domain-containing protein [Cytophagales bacterium]
MYHLVYTSHATKEFAEHDLIELLKECRGFNKQNGITGMLLHLQGKFIQVLEGEKLVVEQIYAKIKADARHTKVVTVIQGNSPERIFKGWTMGFKRLTFEDAEQLTGFRDIDIFFEKQEMKGDKNLLLLFLEMFYKKNAVDYAEL